MPRYLLLLLIPLAVALTACANIDRTSWQLSARPDDTDTTLQLIVLVGGCDDFERFDARETEVDVEGQLIESVTIEAYVHSGARSDCDAILNHEERTVELNAPLGDRKLKGCSPPSAKYGPIRSALPNDDCGSVLPR